MIPGLLLISISVGIVVGWATGVESLGIAATVGMAGVVCICGENGLFSKALKKWWEEKMWGDDDEFSGF